MGCKKNILNILNAFMNNTQFDPFNILNVPYGQSLDFKQNF